jgi:hypothetical protein
MQSPPKKRQAQAADRPQEENEGATKEGKTEEEGTHYLHENDLILFRVQQMLLPLLMKEEMINQDFWAPDIYLVAVGAALNSIVRDLRQHQDGSLSVILETVQARTSPNTKENATVPGANAQCIWLVCCP